MSPSSATSCKRTPRPGTAGRCYQCGTAPDTALCLPELAAPPWVTTQPLPSGLWWHSVAPKGTAGGAAFPRKALRHSAITFCCAVPSQAGRRLTSWRRTRAFPEAEVPAAEASAAPELLASGPVRLHTTAVSCKLSKLRGALLLHLWH